VQNKHTWAPLLIFHKAHHLEDNKELPSIENINLNPTQPQPTHNTKQHKHGARGKHQIVRIISRVVIGCLQVRVQPSPEAPVIGLNVAFNS